MSIGAKTFYCRERQTNNATAIDLWFRGDKLCAAIKEVTAVKIQDLRHDILAAKCNWAAPELERWR